MLETGGISYSAGIHWDQRPRCDTAKLWQRALMLLTKLRREEVGSQRHGLQRWGACSACETCEGSAPARKNAKWQWSLALLSELRG